VVNETDPYGRILDFLDLLRCTPENKTLNFLDQVVDVGLETVSEIIIDGSEIGCIAHRVLACC
jgi:hypothetical protein